MVFLYTNAAGALSLLLFERFQSILPLDSPLRVSIAKNQMLVGRFVMFCFRTYLQYQTWFVALAILLLPINVMTWLMFLAVKDSRENRERLLRSVGSLSFNSPNWDDFSIVEVRWLRLGSAASSSRECLHSNRLSVHALLHGLCCVCEFIRENGRRN